MCERCIIANAILWDMIFSFPNRELTYLEPQRIVDGEGEILFGT